MLQGLPHAASDEEAAVLNWRTESALAERTPINMVATRIFFSMISPFSVPLFRPCWCRAFRLADARGPSARTETTTAWTFTEVAGFAEASTRHNCMCASLQLVER